METKIAYCDETGDYDSYIKSSNTFIKCAVKPFAFSYGGYQLRGKGNLIMKDTQLQFYLQDGFIDRLADNDIIAQRVTDGYINATAMCKAARKKINDYGRLSTTQAFLAELIRSSSKSSMASVMISTQSPYSMAIRRTL